MVASDPPFELTAASTLAVPNGTAIATYEDDVVVSGTGGTKTLSGETATLCTQFLAACDGATPLGEVAESVGDEATTLAIATALCADGIVYPVAWLDAFDVDEGRHSLLESLLLAVDAAERDSFARQVRELTVHVRGDSTPAQQLRASLDAVGCDRDGESPDVLVFCETETTDGRERVNRQWLSSDAVLVRAHLDGPTVTVGPVLTPSSAACLACLTTREELNDAGQSLDYRRLRPRPTYAMELLTQLLTQLTLRAGLGLVPASLVGHIARFDAQTFEHQRARLLGVPGCEACDGDD